MALQAMASYETNTHQGPLDVVATVTAKDFSHAFTVNENNKLLEQLQKLPTFPTDVTVNIEGQGCAVMQVSLVDRRLLCLEPFPSTFSCI